ncbi:MAG TPA: CHAT domain-containing tetratricopeptide repeat protein, partial [Myxococcaceae bacterium]
AAHDGLREWQQAGALHSRAATIYRKKLGPRHPKLGQVFQAWGVSRQNAGDVAGARPLFESALAIYERTYGPDSQWVSEPLGSLALVHAAQGDLPGARQRASRVMGLALASGEKEQLWNSWADGAQVLARSKQLPAAVFFAKRAVNLVQQMREEVADLGRPLQRSFFKRREAVYRDLLGWLVALGRLTEAEEVLTMLKEEEYFDFVRESLRSGDGGAARVSTSAREAAVGAGYEQASQRLIAAGRRMREATEAGPAAPREELRQQIDAHPLEVEQVIRGLSTRRGAEIAEPTAGGTLPAGTAELRYVVGESGLRILVRTGLGRRAFRVQMGAARLNERIFALRQALLDPRRDPRPAARSLHDVLLRPAEPELRRAGVERLELTLDGTLGLIPFAALHDGDRYLIERYAVAVHTLAAPGAGTPTAGADRLAAFGTSQALAGLAPLPRVTSELRHIVRTGGPSDEGILPGVLFLDREFTAQRLRQTLAEGYPLVHIASHFIFRPGPLDRSFLVLGDGGRLTLEQLKRGELPMQGV